MNTTDAQEAVLRDVLRDVTIAERIEQIERALKFDFSWQYRRELMREYLALVTDPEEQP